MNPNIKICYSCNQDAASTEMLIVSTYPETYDRHDTTRRFAWTMSIADPRNLIQDFSLKMGAKPVYAIWERANGRYYAIMTPNNNARGGFDIITMFFQGVKPQMGKSVFTALKQLLPLYQRQNGNVAPASVDVLLGSIVTTPNTATSSSVARESGYNLYRDDNELIDTFDFVDSNMLGTVKCLYLLDANAVAAEPRTSMRKIANVVTNRTYSIVNQEGKLLCTKKQGEKCEVSFNKQGCDPTPVSFIAGSQTTYATYNGNTIVVKNANEINLVYNKHININLVDVYGRSVSESDANILVNGSRVIGGQYTFKETDTSTVGITVTGCYKLENAQRTTVPLAQCANGQAINLRVISTKTEVVVTLQGKMEKIMLSDSFAKSIGTGRHILQINGNRWSITTASAVGGNVRTGGRDHEHNSGGKGKAIVWIAGVVLLIGCVYGAFYYFDHYEGVTTNDIVDRGPTPPSPTQPDQTQLEKVDVAYLKKASQIDGKECWNLDSIKSDKYSVIRSLLNDVDIARLDTFAYNKLLHEEKNGWWIKMMNNAHKVKPQVNAEEIIRNGMVGNEFKIQEVVEKLNLRIQASDAVEAIEGSHSPSAGSPSKPSAGTPSKPSAGTPSKPSVGTPSKPSAGTPSKPSAKVNTKKGRVLSD